ncbi:rhodanese-like domain-containing protein [Acuticoccus sp. MNP-M23]|uniref:rhodanese-like domain-containing protein n=1 Tax=Acuticoccus sp. MNP-M23 TaxID=3072793 RepID=UPI00281598A4|nr:rhodanese-like domain-containing protein [Acuticoccus sp. MNP-M23]WMS44878.1 rhodanese-like domain-containing protein [Acuticoccus sp. MNP-M23]
MTDIPDVRPAEAMEAVNGSAPAMVVDVRTRAEWAYVGIVDLSAASTQPVLIEWQTFPDMTVDPAFGDALAHACPDKETALYFLCRSGARSLAAAREMAGRGYAKVFNIADGFEGPPDELGHRGHVAGWKAEGLPWRQS